MGASSQAVRSGPAQTDSHFLGCRDPDGKENSRKNLLGTAFQNDMGLGDPPGVPASSPSVSPPLTPPLFSALCLLIPHSPSLLKALGCYGNPMQPRKLGVWRGSEVSSPVDPALISISLSLGDIIYCAFRKWQYINSRGVTWVPCFTPIIPIFSKLRWEDCQQLKASLGYIVNSKSAQSCLR